MDTCTAFWAGIGEDAENSRYCSSGSTRPSVWFGLCLWLLSLNILGGSSCTTDSDLDGGSCMSQSCNSDLWLLQTQLNQKISRLFSEGVKSRGASPVYHVVASPWLGCAWHAMRFLHSLSSFYCVNPSHFANFPLIFLPFYLPRIHGAVDGAKSWEWGWNHFGSSLSSLLLIYVMCFHCKGTLEFTQQMSIFLVDPVRFQIHV